MQKTGQIERTVDREFADEEAKYRVWAHSHAAYPYPHLTLRDRFEKECQALQKDTVGYLTAMRCAYLLSAASSATSCADHLY